MFATLVSLWLLAQLPEASVKEKGAATPEEAARGFIVAILSGDAPALRSVALPNKDVDMLLQSPGVDGEALTKLKAEIAKLPVRLLKEGEEVSLPGGGKYKAKGVTDRSAIALPRGASYPVKVLKEGTRWRVDASPIIASYKAAAPEAVDPAKIKNKIAIKIGQKLDVQFLRKGDVISEPKVVDKAKTGELVVHVEFTRVGENLTLGTQNPFSGDLSFRALARNKGSQSYYETSIVPVKAGLVGIELWRDPIEELILFEFGLVGDKR